MSATGGQALQFARLGYVPVSTVEPAIQCATNPLETWATTTWDGLLDHAINFQLCACGSHHQSSSNLLKEES